VLRVALGYGIIFTRSDLRQLIHAVNYSIFWCCYVVSHCDLDLWPLDLELLLHFGCRVFKLCTKFERNRIIHGWVAWVIDDLARFRRTILGGGQFYRAVLRGVLTHLHQTWRGHRAIMTTQEFVSEFGYLAAFSNAGGSKLSDVENDAKFRTFWPLWKLGEGWARSLYQLLKPYLRPNLLNTFDGHQLCGCLGRCIDKKKKSKEKKVHGYGSRHSDTCRTA